MSIMGAIRCPHLNQDKEQRIHMEIHAADFTETFKGRATLYLKGFRSYYRLPLPSFLSLESPLHPSILNFN